MTYILRDCVEYDCIYYILHFTDENINRVDIDNEINKIKNSIDEDIVEDIVKAVLEELATIYDFTMFDFNGYLEI